MDKLEIERIKIIAQNQLENLSEDEQSAAYYLRDIVLNAEILLNDAY